MKSSVQGKGRSGVNKPTKKDVVVGKRNRPSSKSSSKSSKKAKAADNKLKNECNGCLEELGEEYTLPCGHTFCKGCVQGLFQAAVNDHSLLPVKCCGKRVDQRLRRVVLTLDECDQFETALEELEAPNQLFWYTSPIFQDFN